MPDEHYADAGLASLYDALNPRETAEDFEFYLPMIMAAESVLLDVPSLNAFVVEAGLVVDEQYGYWDRSPVTGASPEIVTIARRPLSGSPATSP